MAYHPDFLVYFALPHVPEPEQHPSFQHLLDPRCMAAQRAQLEIFLSMLPRSGRQPRLYTMLQGSASNRHVEPGCSKQVEPVARKDLKSLLKGDAELEEFVQPFEGELGAKGVAESLKDPPFKAVERASASHTNIQELCGASTREICDKQLHTASPLSAQAPGRDASPPRSIETHQDTAAAGAEDVSIAQSSGEHVRAPQDGAEHTPSKPTTTEEQTTVGQQALNSVAATGQGDIELASSKAASPQQNQEEDATKGGAHSPSSPDVQASPNKSVAEESPGIPGSESHNDGLRDTVQSSPRRSLEDPTLCAILDGPVAQAAQQHQRAPQVVLSRSESIIRTSFQQSQLPAIDWESVKSHLRSRDNGYRARLLQVCAPEHTTCIC